MCSQNLGEKLNFCNYYTKGAIVQCVLSRVTQLRMSGHGPISNNPQTISLPKQATRRVLVGGAEGNRLYYGVVGALPARNSPQDCFN